MTNKETMTNKEAKDVLQEQIDRYGQEYDAEGIEALEIAINVLEQQPCEDAISRQDAVDIINGYAEQFNGYIGTPNDTEVYAYARGLLLSIERNISALPPVTPKAELCEDCISREALYEALSEWDEQDVYLPYHFKELVAELPSVTWSGWIPVSEKLPEPDMAVLLHVKYKSSGQWTYQLGMWNDNKQAWEDWRTPYQLEEEFEVIAWMELPEKYEEDNHE